MIFISQNIKNGKIYSLSDKECTNNLVRRKTGYPKDRHDISVIIIHFPTQIQLDYFLWKILVC